MPKKLKGGGSEKINDIVYNLFSKDKIEYLPLSSIFINNISHKYVHMVNLLELRKIIDNNSHLKQSNIIMNIYKNKHVISLNEIYNNIELTMLNDSLEENVKLLFQFIMEYNVNRYVRKETDIFSIITCNEDFDEAYETEISMTLLNKMFDIRDIDSILENTKDDIMNEKLFRELVESKMRKCSEKPYSLMDLFTGEISFDSNKKCELPNNKLLRLNGENLIFLSDNVNNLSYGDKMKLLILFEHRLSLLSKYFSLEVLRRKNAQKSNVKKLLNKILQLDIAGNSRTLTKRVIDKNNDIIDSDLNKEISEDSNLSESDQETSLQEPLDMSDSGESITSSSLSEPSEPSVSVSQSEEVKESDDSQILENDLERQPTEENDSDKDKLERKNELQQDNRMDGELVGGDLSELDIPPEGGESTPAIGAPPTPTPEPGELLLGEPPALGAPTPEPGAPTPEPGAPTPEPGAPTPEPGAPTPEPGAPTLGGPAPPPEPGAPTLGAPPAVETPALGAPPAAEPTLGAPSEEPGALTPAEPGPVEEPAPASVPEILDNTSTPNMSDIDENPNINDKNIEDPDLQPNEVQDPKDQPPDEPTEIQPNIMEHMDGHKSEEKLPLEERLTNAFRKIMKKGEIRNMFKEEYKVIKDKIGQDPQISETRKIVMSDKCGQLKNNLINKNAEYLDVEPDMMDMLSQCNDIDVKSGLNHKSAAVAAAAAGGGHRFF